MGFDIGSALGGGILGGFAGGYSNDQKERAAQIAADAQKAGIAEQRRQFDLTRSDLLPFLQGGIGAQSQLQDILSGKFDINQDPLLQQQLGLANKAAGRFASAGGSLGTGAYQKNLLRGTSDVFNNRINQLLALRSGGQSAGGTLGSLGQATSANIGQGLANIGQIQAAPYIGKANTIDNLLNLGSKVGLAALMG